MRRKKSHKGFMVVNIDLEKAYDRISWNFLRKVLEEVGFGNDMLELIMFTVTSVSLSVLWNGERLESFQFQRGLRQGDPLAPYILVLCMGFSCQKINHAVEEEKWKYVRASRYGPPVSHLLFADHLLLFEEATENQAYMMEEIIADFCKTSGQKVNTAKSKLFVSPNIRDNVAAALSQTFDIPLTTDLGMYLEMPLLHGRVTAGTYSPLVDKVRSKLASWKGRLLSRSARSLLVQSVTSIVAFYGMNSAEIPITTINSLERLNRQFSWGEYDNDRRFHTIAWEVICQPKEFEGMGIMRLKMMNHALLAMLAWRLIQGDDVLWVKVLKSKYGDPLQDTSTRKACTHTWRSILNDMLVIRE